MELKPLPVFIDEIESYVHEFKDYKRVCELIPNVDFYKD